MKNILFLVIAAVIAFLAYSYFTTQNKSTTPEPTVSEDTTAEMPEPANDALKDLISKSPEGADVFILEPGDGTTVSSPVTVKFGITNMVVAKAGDNVENSGHHHLLINLDELPDMTVPLPATDQIIHFGGAQTETTIELEPGEHTLQLLLGNYLHIPHDKPVLSKKITITVE